MAGLGRRYKWDALLLGKAAESRSFWGNRHNCCLVGATNGACTRGSMTHLPSRATEGIVGVVDVPPPIWPRANPLSSKRRPARAQPRRLRFGHAS